MYHTLYSTSDFVFIGVNETLVFDSLLKSIFFKEKTTCDKKEKYKYVNQKNQY